MRIIEVTFTKEKFLADAHKAAEKYDALPEWKKAHLTFSQPYYTKEKKMKKAFSVLLRRPKGRCKSTTTETSAARKSA